MPETIIASFVVRFTQDPASGQDLAAPDWRGVVRHVQSDDQVRFTRMEDAITFMARYVDLATGQDEEQAILKGSSP